MAAVIYEAKSLSGFLGSDEVKRFMTGVGDEGATIARSYSPHPDAITPTVLTAFGRWVVNITNTHEHALLQEYGGRNLEPVAPLGHVLDHFRSADPNNRKTSRLGF